MQNQTKTLRIPNISTTDHYFTVPMMYMLHIYIYINVNIPIIKPCFCRDPSDFPGGAWGRPRFRPLVAAGFARHRGGVPAINMVISGKVYYIVLATLYWLVVGCPKTWENVVFWNIFYCSIIYGNNDPSWLSYFSEGVKPPTSICFIYDNLESIYESICMYIIYRI